MNELTTFAQKHNSFEAEEGCNDDLAMCLVIFAWLVAQDYFKEMTDNDIRKEYMKSKRIKLNKIWHHLVLLQMVLTIESFVDKDGDRWYADEYGDRSYMWDYM